MQGAQELHSADMSRDPADGPLDCFDTIEPDPDMLSNRRPFDEFDLTPFTGGIENPDSIPARASAPQPDLGVQILSAAAARLMRTSSIGRHAQ
jgi:hypothetical protein